MRPNHKVILENDDGLGIVTKDCFNKVRVFIHYTVKTFDFKLKVGTHSSSSTTVFLYMENDLCTVCAD